MGREWMKYLASIFEFVEFLINVLQYGMEFFFFLTFGKSLTQEKYIVDKKTWGTNSYLLRCPWEKSVSNNIYLFLDAYFCSCFTICKV
jgi:hypothetical protein